VRFTKLEGCKKNSAFLRLTFPLDSSSLPKLKLFELMYIVYCSQAVAQTASQSSLSEPAEDIFFEVRSNPILLLVATGINRI
jgi:hydroxyacyl-ACP dehydratase HTD2-like protein with hotdog domain